MKIGQVVRQYHISLNTLYFYIHNGLLVPPRKNGQYVFDERTLAELEWLLELKEMDFPLKTIHRLLSLRRISNFYSEEDQNELRGVYEAHMRELQDKETALATARQKTQQNLLSLTQHTPPIARTGVPVRMLHLLCCPQCGGEFLLENAAMSQNHIFQATLRCACGYSAVIRDGVLQTPNFNTSLYDKPDTTRELYRDLPSHTLSLFEHSYRWLEEHIAAAVGGGKVWLEGYVTAWFFLHNHLELLHPDDCLIVVDKFAETLLAYKEVIDRQGAPCDILYIADSSSRPPLKGHIVDCVMDFFASNEHNFYHSDLYLDQLIPYLKPDSQLFGVYFFFQNGRRSMKTLLSSYPEAADHNFNIHWFLQETKRNFRMMETLDCGFSTDSGKNLGLGFHVTGEELHLQAYWAKAVKK